MTGDGGVFGKRRGNDGGNCVRMAGKRENVRARAEDDGPGGILPAIGERRTIFGGIGIFATGIEFSTRKFAICFAVLAVRFTFGSLSYDIIMAVASVVSTGTSSSSPPPLVAPLMGPNAFLIDFNT